MSIRISNIKYFFIGLFTFCLFLSALQGCKKADDFNEKLKSLPQIDYSSDAAYKSAYIVGDTMVISGRLQPQNDLNISIGGINATIINTVSTGADTGKVAEQEDKVSFLIEAAMVGKNREVKVTTGGYSALGSPIDVYTVGGEGSFNSTLTAVRVTQSTLSNTYKFLYALTGKGDVFYYAPATKDIRRIQKDGTTNVFYDLSALNITNFLAGAIDAQEQNLYFSVQVPSGYALYKYNLAGHLLTTLNQSAGLTAPYEGAIGSVQMIVTGIYPDNKGNLYLGIGIGNQAPGSNALPDAIARYLVIDGTVRYMFKGLVYGQTYAGMPGVKIIAGNGVSGIRFNPEENLLYMFIAGLFHDGIQLYDLSTGTLLQDLEPSNPAAADAASQYDVIAPFSALKINLRNAVNNSFGYLPMPNRRLQTLLFQDFNQSARYGFPKWIVFDFGNQRTYAYGLGKFDSGQFSFRSNDQLLNYDEAGNLYMSGNGMSYLLKTQPN